MENGATVMVPPATIREKSPKAAEARRAASEYTGTVAVAVPAVVDSGGVDAPPSAMINFQKKMPDNRRFLKMVTEWVEEALPDTMDDATVMVNEMQCFEPGCPPLETVVTLLDKQSIVFKIFKPVREVTPEEVDEGLQAVLSGQVAAQHVGQLAQVAAAH